MDTGTVRYDPFIRIETCAVCKDSFYWKESVKLNLFAPLPTLLSLIIFFFLSSFLSPGWQTIIDSSSKVQGQLFLKVLYKPHVDKKAAAAENAAAALQCDDCYFPGRVEEEEEQSQGDQQSDQIGPFSLYKIGHVVKHFHYIQNWRNTW